MWSLATNAAQYTIHAKTTFRIALIELILRRAIFVSELYMMDNLATRIQIRNQMQTAHVPQAHVPPISNSHRLLKRDYFHTVSIFVIGITETGRERDAKKY